MAYRTSCATIVHEGGVHCEPDIVADAEGRELVQHGSALFPIACYAEDLASYSVAWHWHEEFEYILTIQGPLHVDVNKTRLTLQTGQGVFLNSGALHSVEQAEGTALLHSGVFQPRLVGGMDTIFWQKLIRPPAAARCPGVFSAGRGGALAETGTRLSAGRLERGGGRAVRLREPGAVSSLGGAAAAEHPVRGRQDQSLGAGADRLGADEADAPLRGGALRRGANGEEDRGLRGPERERLPAQLPAAAGHHAHPVRQAVPGRKGRRAAALHPAEDRRDRSGMWVLGRQLLIKTFREIKHCTPREYRTKFC